MYDVIIIGGGPAGSVIGSYLSQAGVSNLIIESAIHPRPHVGESMVTATTRVFTDIGFLPVMEREGFIKKFGAGWHPPDRRGDFNIEFREFPQEGIHQDYTYHVDRAKFDTLLLKHAQGKGSKIIEGVPVKEVLFDDKGYACGVRITIGDQDMDLKCKVVVDASGRSAILGRKKNLMKKDPIFDQYAVHAWFENLDLHQGGKSDEQAHFIHIYFLPVERGWVWQIPITDKITSVGVVTEREVFRQAKKDYDEFFWQHVNFNPDMKATMANARRINEYKAEGDYSYSMSSFCGDGFVMIGDAARFVDPIFSSGVSVACYSAKFASERIIEALKTGDFSEANLKPYERKLRKGVDIWYEFIRLYYKLLPLFTYFISSKNHRLEVLRLLQGEVYERGEAPVLEAMRRYIEMIEKSPDHAFRSRLTSIPIDDLDIMKGELPAPPPPALED